MAQLGRKPHSDKGTGRPRSLWLSPEANERIDEAVAKDPSLSGGRAASLLIESADPRWPERARKMERENRLLVDRLGKRETDLKEMDRHVKAMEKLVARITAGTKDDKASLKTIEKLDLTGLHPRLRAKAEKAFG